MAAQIVINRPHKRNAFTPLTVREMSLCFADARDDPAIGVIVLTGAAGHSLARFNSVEVLCARSYPGLNRRRLHSAAPELMLNFLGLLPWRPAAGQQAHKTEQICGLHFSRCSDGAGRLCSTP